jgi:hypothetical protein
VGLEFPFIFKIKKTMLKRRRWEERQHHRFIAGELQFNIPLLSSEYGIGQAQAFMHPFWRLLGLNLCFLKVKEKRWFLNDWHGSRIHFLDR